MKFQNRTIYKQIDLAIIKAERLLDANSLMMQEIRFKNDFKYNSGLGWEIYNTLTKVTPPLEIYTYRPKWRNSKAIGGFIPGTNHMSLNIYKLDELKFSELVWNLCHEYAHYRGFNHGFGLFRNYRTKEKELYSVPYWFSANVERFL